MGILRKKKFMLPDGGRFVSSISGVADVCLGPEAEEQVWSSKTKKAAV